MPPGTTMNNRSAKTSSASATHPIGDLADGWRFRLTEISAGCYEIEGFDGAGRRVYRQGTDPDALKQLAAADARGISNRGVI
jgi:hypothetical protein